jgi:hypothetical protein
MKKIVLLFIGIGLSYLSFGQILVSEDFTGAFPPSGWAIDAHAANWKSSGTTNAGGTAPEADFHYSPVFDEVSRLMSPVVNTSGMTSAPLVFKHAINWYQGSFTVGVATRSGSGPWTSVWETNVTAIMPATVKTITIQNADIGQPDFQFCFYFSGNSDNIDDWFIDDVEFGVAVDHDISVSDIPIKNFYAVNEPIAVKSVVENKGTSVATFDVKCEIFDPSNVSQFSNTKTVTALASGNTSQVVFDPFPLALENAAYRVKITSLLTGDQNVSNDTMTKSVHTLTGDQIYLENFGAGIMPPPEWSIEDGLENWSIQTTSNAGGTSPEARFYFTPLFEGVSRLVSPVVNTTGKSGLLLTFKQVAYLYANNYHIGVATRSGGGAWTSVWDTDVTVELPQEVREVYIFSSDVGAADFQYCFYYSGNSDNTDGWYIDDAMLTTALAHDAGVNSINGSASFTAGDSYAASAEVQNKGIQPETYDVVLNIKTLSGSTLFTNTKSITQTPGEVSTVTFDNYTLADPDQLYVVSVSTLLSGDQEPSNNSKEKDVNTYTAIKDNVLMEVGTGTWCYYCPGSALGAEDLLANGCKVAVVEYHGGDSYENPMSNERVNNYYGITGFPSAIFDGLSWYVGGDHTVSNYTNYLPLYINQLNVKTPAKLQVVATSLGGGSYQFDLTAQKLAPLRNQNLKLFLAVTESHIEEAWQGQSELNSVFRTMLPDANGASIDLVNNTSVTSTQTLTLDPSWVSSELEFIAWIQDIDTKQVMNTTKFSFVNLGLNHAGNEIKANVYPNPFTVSTEINFTLNETSVVKVAVYDNLGRLISVLHDGSLAARNCSFSWNGLDKSGNPMPSGLYNCILQCGGKSSSFKLMKN